MSNLTLNTKTYSGLGINAGVTKYQERSSGVASGFSNLDQKISFDDKKIIRNVTRLYVPVVAAAASNCTCEGDVLRTTDAILTVRIPQTATAAERLDFVKRLQAMVMTPEFAASISDLVQMPG